MEYYTPASIILESTPKIERAKLVRRLIESLQFDDNQGLEFVASMVKQLSDQETTEALLSHLDEAIQNGKAQHVTSVVQKFPSVGDSLLWKAAEILSQAKSVENGQYNDLTVHSYLSFVKFAVFHLATTEARSVIFRACLDLLDIGKKDISTLARDFVITVLSPSNQAILDEVVRPSYRFIWKSIRNLASKKNTLHTLDGYSIWLRWLSCAETPHLEEFINDRYWKLLIHGLRHGDVERRKLCLNILRLTIKADPSAASDNVREQYDRYCTVFETIVLGRYINQIQECEPDLRFLATGSCLQPHWLYTLLASALDSRMQDSNRKFIGNWVMRSGLPPCAEFIEFFQNDFLPWAISGQLFVSTLKKCNGMLRCVHGYQLSQFVKRLLKDSPEPHDITDVITRTILKKKHSMFAYATVFLLEGLNGALTSDQMAKISELINLPDVARDVVKLRTNKLVTSDIEQVPTSRREVLEKQAIEKCSSFDPELDSLDEIWDDLDYLEYPKRLLMIIPGQLLHPRIVERALEEPTLAIDLAKKFEVLSNTAVTKTFLFSPLVTALRKILSINPTALHILNIGKFIEWVVDNPPEPTIDLMLEEAIIPLTPFTYEHYFGERPSHGFAAFFDIVSRLDQNQTVLSEVLNHVLEQWRNQKVPPLIVSSWKTTLQLQVLLLCFEQFKPNTTARIRDLLEDLFHILAIEPLPRYRYLLEWIVVRLFVRYPLQDVLFTRLASKDHHSNPKHLASLMKIGTILACRTGSEEAFSTRLATAFVPLAASSKVVIRHEAQWQIPLLMDHARVNRWISITENPAFRALDEYVRSLERFHDPPQERKKGRFDPATDHTLTNLVEGPWFELDELEAPRTSRAEFVKLYETDAGLDMLQTCMPLGNPINPLDVPQTTLKEGAADNVPIEHQTTNESSALQTKGLANLARSLAELSPGRSRANDIIVVGSLVENPHNLGGLSRVSEIFGASQLCLQNQNVLSNKDFTSVSVSSHLHFPIVQLSISGIPGFLAEKKSEGFKVVGIEQTDRSIVLGAENAILPKKVVLVVGSEREGIPAIVLTQCDILVEIPQQGITRSLNVQTAVSIVLYEHARQHIEVRP